MDPNLSIMRKHVLYYNEPSSQSRSPKHSLSEIVNVLKTEQEKRSLQVESATHQKPVSIDKVEITPEDVEAFNRALSPEGAFRKAVEQALEKQEKMRAEGGRPLWKQEEISKLQAVLKGENPGYQDEEFPDATVTFRDLAAYQDKLSPEEFQAIALYTSCLYNLMNAFLSQNGRLVKDSMKKMGIARETPPRQKGKGRETPTDPLKEDLKVISKVLISGINKAAKSNDTVIYRGAVVQEKELELMQKQSYMIDSNVASFSKDVEDAGDFSARKVEGEKIIYVLNRPQNARDIDQYSIYTEGERIYLPGQCFQCLKVESAEEYFEEDFEDLDLYEGMHFVHIREVSEEEIASENKT